MGGGNDDDDSTFHDCFSSPVKAAEAAAAAFAAVGSNSRWEDNEAADSDAEEDLSFLDAPIVEVTR